MFTAKQLVAALLLSMAACTAMAGGSGLNTVVIVNQNNSDSVQLGNDYCELRGVPPQNLLRVTNWTGGIIQWNRSQFESCLLQPLLGMLSARGLSNQVDRVVLSMGFPYRVYDNGSYNSTTSTLYYGFKPDITPPSGLPASCSLPPSSLNSYAFSETPFRQTHPAGLTTNAFLAFMLTSSNLAQAQTVLARGVASDSTFPTQSVHLFRTGDAARSVRYVEFDEAIFSTRVQGDYSVIKLYTSSTEYINMLGMQTGLSSLWLATNAFLPGAIGDSLTSYAGDLFENSGQSPLLVFLNAGAAGSYGTVVEPCNYTEKFPHPLDYFYQARGFSLAEAYYQSLENPYQGICVGEPLSAPFARRGTGVWTSPGDGATLSGSAPMTIEFLAASTNLPLNQVDLFLDGELLQTVTNLPPTLGNYLSLTINGFTAHHFVASTSSVVIAQSFASALNIVTNSTQVIAYPAGDRLELQALNPATPGSLLSVSTTSAAGTASKLTTFLTAARPSLLDSTSNGQLDVRFDNATNTGDWLELRIVKTNGTTVTVSVTNTIYGSDYAGFVRSLATKVSSTPALQTDDGVFNADFWSSSRSPAAGFSLYAWRAGWPSARIRVTLRASAGVLIQPSGSTNYLESNLDVLRPRNNLYITSGASQLPVSFTVDTTKLADGFHELTAVAYEGTSVRTQTRVIRNVQIQNTPLTATLITLVGGTNTALEATLQFAVTASTGNLARIELFTTGGSVGAVTNQPTASFAISAASLGMGLHPFYALVTDNSGNTYRTATQWLRIVNTETPFTITLSGTPPAITWPALAGRHYEILSTTDLNSPFQLVSSVTSSNCTGIWPLPAGNTTNEWFKVRSAP